MKIVVKTILILLFTLSSYNLYADHSCKVTWEGPTQSEVSKCLVTFCDRETEDDDWDCGTKEYGNLTCSDCFRKCPYGEGPCPLDP